MARPKKVSLAATSADKTKSDAAARNADDQRKAAEAPKPTTHGLPSAPANVKPAVFHSPDPRKAEQEVQKNRDARQVMEAMAASPKPIVEAKPEPDGPMSLADVNAILADNYPGFVPANVRGDASGLKFALPGGGSIMVERSKVKKCANMEELRAYIDSVK